MILRAIGLMSGTSMDGIDAVLMETDGIHVINPKANISITYDPEFKNALRAAELEVREAKSNVASLDVIRKSTELHALAVQNLLKKANLTAKDIDVIGYHGQALYHKPIEGITIQIGDGRLLADLARISVVNNFRADDIKNGGQGAPLAPLYHQALAVRDQYFPVAVVNCGGIANISIINGADDAQVIGFDTGPGNVLIDRYIREKTNSKEFMDFDGKYGLNGKVNQEILEKMMKDFKPYLDKSPPKSLDPGDFHLPKELAFLSMEDACATLEAFTTKSIIESLNDQEIPKKWILAGGGWNNPVITKFLQKFLQEKIGTYDMKLASEIGWDNVYMEAEIFAYLAVRKLHKLPISLPSVTGAIKPSFGGTLYTACKNTALC